MKLSEFVSQKLEAWISSDTWYRHHDNDMARFFEFVDAYQADHGYQIPDESVLAETIAAKASISTDDELFSEIQDKVCLMYTILDFLKVTGR
ncbi:hypothetical protein ACEV9E_21415 [Vibrio parahaemolyticus]|uniref:hypothetical protein n=1 Tax=Vibrio parahaemolyticus TaxID=670 RepID=UPI00046CC9FD|nr:hypothetical protein [Vibrio parahaemolyticus]EHH1057652.1 hypothetical protein [Vibrio parahaemolyticus]EJE8522677.1 hypothetical protein [Vibrio parahaemolyticus]ELS9504826.1 hypothetical protein [Vibrio parahaemolyticus]MBE3981355.1 hypothetical protein [Vibrio parahaemolyticus]MBE4399479.1 hypothetical protein [Vibrio parahaemolyticus]